MTEILILADGDFPKHITPLTLLNRVKNIICCDGSAAKIISKNIIPTAIVGDMDSLNIDLQEKFRDIIYKSTSQQTNDLTKAFNFALESKPDKIYILGATGAREDHTLGNISLLSEYKSLTKAEVLMYTDSGIFRPIDEPTTFKCNRGSQVSIFSLDPKIRVQSKGLKFSTDEVIFDSWWKATLNEAADDEFSLNFKNGKLIVFIAY